MCISRIAFCQHPNMPKEAAPFVPSINDCTKIIQINAGNIDAYYMRGILRINFGDLKNGCLDLSKAGELGDHKAYEAIKEKCNQKTQDSE